MASAKSLIKKIDKSLNKVNAVGRSVYKRVITRTGGDPLLGRPASISTLDTLIKPTPAVSYPRPNDPVISVGGSMVQITDLILIVSVDALSFSDLSNKDVVIVFKRGTAEEQYRIQAYEPFSIYGQDIAYQVLVRSVK